MQTFPLLFCPFVAFPLFCPFVAFRVAFCPVCCWLQHSVTALHWNHVLLGACFVFLKYIFNNSFLNLTDLRSFTEPCYPSPCCWGATRFRLAPAVKGYCLNADSDVVSPELGPRICISNKLSLNADVSLRQLSKTEYYLVLQIKGFWNYSVAVQNQRKVLH